MSDLVGNRADLGFQQPVALERLIPVEMLPLAQVTEDQATRILISDRGRERPATIKAQATDGRVYIRYDDTDKDECVDLASLKYQWI